MTATNYKALLQPVQPHLIAVCPTMDLVAAATAHNQLEVFRFDGQRAFGWRRGMSPLEISSLRWSANGAHLVLAWSDEMIEIVDAKLGKVVSQHPLAPPNLVHRHAPGSGQLGGPDEDGQEKKRAIDFVGWGSNLLDGEALKFGAVSKRTAITRLVKNTVEQGRVLGNAFKEERSAVPTLEDFQARVPNPRLIAPEGEAASLPLQLMQLDVESELLQLSALPQIEDPLALDFEADRFATQELIHARLPFADGISNTAAEVTVQLACGDDGSLTTFVYQGFFAGVHELNTSSSGRTSKVIAHASHPFSTTHVLLRTCPRETQDPSKTSKLALQVIDYQAILQSTHFLPLVYRKVSNMLELSRYISLTIVCLRAAWTACQDLPQRWLSNGAEMFTPEHKTDLIAAMYRLVVTGHCHPLLKQWLTDDIGERNHKRWDAAVSTNYTKIIELVQRHLLPALDRTTVVASSLRALANTPNIPVFKLDERHLTRIIHDADILRLIAHRVLQYARLEAIQFATFSAWLATQAALQNAERNQSTANELAERAAEIDPTPLLTYILGALTRSKLNFFLSRASAEVVAAPRRPQQQIRTLPLLAQILDRHAEKSMQPSSQPGVVEIVDMLYQALFLGDSVREVYAVVPAGLARGTAIGKPLDVCGHGEAQEGVWDVRLVYELAADADDTTGDFAVYTLFSVTSDEPSVTVQRRSLSSTASGSSLGEPSEVVISLPSGSTSSTSRGMRILSLKFLDDQDFVALVADADTKSSRIIRFCYSNAVGQPQQTQSHETLSETTAPEVIKEWDHQKDNFRPRNLVVSKEKQRVRCVCLDEARRKYSVVAFNDPGA